MRFDVIVETPRGSRNKYEMDAAKQRIRLDRLLFTATAYPYDYGFLPETLAEDGDPLDAMVLGEVPTFPGCVIRSRPIAVFWMYDEQGPDAKVLCVPADDPRFDRYQNMEDVPTYVRGEIGHFFDVYKDLEPGKSANARGWEPREWAERLVEEAFHRFASETPGDREGRH
ncbi:inorganic diphosphatase [Nonomuraea sp. NPDC048916]|uniref:inorganic diphosphatase n=1 Tax=Nonomuraea sp. NPDC048916 TaxID=3154232 RepID=UPI0033CD7399